MFTSHNPSETESHGRNWALQAQSGQIIALQGDLGAGKTQWVKGFAQGLGITLPIQSPTFALVQEYLQARIPLYHLDLYRLNGPDDITGAGLHEYLHSPQGVTVVEWPERWLDEPTLRTSGLPPGWTWIRIESPTETTRQFTFPYGHPRA